ncbi:PREDICTED: calcium uptake protein 1 homolog, mitochondrial-like, partial [Priapulus caudatus]|uniref:Calcium uptake protein 1 homolog, mitochondrial-like n=1 Tax=Priapulus caudatus TaxID=37621 RepID=A0ABM1F5S4_PRICU
FYRKEPVDGRITAVAFADLLLAYAGLPDKIQTRMMRRVKKKFKGSTRYFFTLQFYRKEPVDGRITAVAFADLLLAYAGLPDKIQTRMMRRVKKKFKGSTRGITLEEFIKFSRFLKNITDVDTALTFYHMAGASVDPPTLQHVAKTVAHVDLEDYVVDVVFTLFDENH